MKKILTAMNGFILISVLVIAASALVVIVGVPQMTNDFKRKYEMPDTTITCVNGKCDTVINIKKTPNWLR